MIRYEENLEEYSISAFLGFGVDPTNQQPWFHFLALDKLLVLKITGLIWLAVSRDLEDTELGVYGDRCSTFKMRSWVSGSFATRIRSPTERAARGGGDRSIWRYPLQDHFFRVPGRVG